MENTAENLLKEYVKNQGLTSTAQVMDAMKSMFKDVLEQVMECKLEEKLGFEKSQCLSTDAGLCVSKYYRNGYSKKMVKIQLGKLEVNIPRDRNGSYTPQIIPKYSRNANGYGRKNPRPFRLWDEPTRYSRANQKSL